MFQGATEPTHRGSWTATGAGCGEQWPHTACWEPPGPALSSRMCVSSPRGGWRCAGGAPCGENTLLDLAWHSWCLLWPWGCLGGLAREREGKVERNCGRASSACMAWCLNLKLPTVWCLRQYQISISKSCGRTVWSTGVSLSLYVHIFMSLSRLPLTHRWDVTILFLPWLPSMHHIHPSPLDGSGSL